MILSKKACGISESLTLSIDAKAKKMKSEGYDVVGFGAGEPDFPTPDFIVQAAKEALDKGFTKYTPSSGTLQLRQAICKKFERENHITYTPDEVIVSNGAKHSLYNIFQAILNPGDEVIIPRPYWLSYPEMVRMADGVPVVVDVREEDSFKVSAEDLRKVITPRTKAFVLNNPGNPSGCIYRRRELQAIADLAAENRFFIVSDEIYESLIYDGQKHISIASLNDSVRDLTFTVNGMSKAYAMTGWRIGYAAGPKEAIQVMGNIQSHSTSNPNSIAQYASTVALNAPKDCVQEMVKEFDKRRLYMMERIRSIPYLSCKKPEGAFYIMLNISQCFGKHHGNTLIHDSLSFSDSLLKSRMVTVVPGIAFGADSFVRLSYANSMDNICRGLDRMEEFINELV